MQEKAWIYHEMGKCFYELKNWADAKDFAEMTLDLAKDSGDKDILTNAQILMGRALGIHTILSKYSLLYFSEFLHAFP